MDLGHRLSRPMPIALRAAIAVQVVWMAVAPGQHLLSHAASGLSSVPCPELSAAGDSAPSPWSSGHAACAVCLVLAAGTCLPQAAEPLSIHPADVASALLAATAPLIGAEPALSLQARAPPLG